MSSNKEQQKVIDSINGIYIVDAGAGTGKTHTITQRYLNILKKPKITSDDILLVTFTRNAAQNMKKKVISKADSSQTTDLLDAPILSFDALCSKVVSNNGLNAPEILGIKDNLSNYKLISENVITKNIFYKFYNQFLEKEEKNYQELLTILPKSDQLHNLIETLLSRGIFPTKNGWFLNSINKIKGDLNLYKEIFNELNIEEFDKKGNPIPTEILKYFSKRINDKEFINTPEEIATDNQLKQEVAEDAFNENRKELLDFIHNLYFEYLVYMIKNNNMTFSLIQMFTFLILYTNKKIREDNSYKYVMVDEFQDTNEMQFMLMLLLMKEDNLCVVGDWKQGIYGFRNATITNILEFEEKIKLYKNILNTKEDRIAFNVEKVTHLPFQINYRSSQKILDFSEKALTTKASKNEELEIDLINEEIVSLKANFDYDETSEIDFYSALDRDHEIEVILKNIVDLTNNKEIKVFNKETNKYKTRKVEFKDIAILSRTRTFGLDILKRAQELNIPAQYDGGIELFEEEDAILLLAWLKLLININNPDAWIPILEKENYSYAQIKSILEKKEYPKEILEFKSHLLKNRKVISYIIDEIFKKYHFNSNISNAILNILDNLFHSTLMSISDLIIFIEQNIENKETYNIELNSSTNSIKIQTIHGSKGLEYPIVFVVNCNLKSFPSSIPNTDQIIFHEAIGIRTKKIFDKKYNYIFDNWKTDLISAKLFSDNDEERRLLYVAITRAMHCVYFTSHRPSEFFVELSNDSSTKFEEIKIEKLKRVKQEKISLLKIKTKADLKNKVLAVHDLMSYQGSGKGRGIEFGNKIHMLAFRYLEKLKISKIEKEYKKDFKNITTFIDKELKGAELLSEIDCSLPVNNTMIRGIIDLVAVFKTRVEIIDWKTDMNKSNIEEYKKQLSIYYYVVKEVYNLPVICKIFWSYTGESEKVDVIELKKIVK